MNSLCNVSPATLEGRHLRGMLRYIYGLHDRKWLKKIRLTNTGENFGRYYYNLRVFIHTTDEFSRIMGQRILDGFKKDVKGLTEKGKNDRVIYDTINHWISDMESEAVIKCRDYYQLEAVCEVVSQMLWGISKGIKIEIDIDNAYKYHRDEETREEEKREKEVDELTDRKALLETIEVRRNYSREVATLENRLELLESKYKYPEVKDLIYSVRTNDTEYPDYIKNKTIKNRLREVAALKKRINNFKLKETK